MVKGITRRVLIVKNPDRDLFDEAIFIVREEAPQELRSEDILYEAQAVATQYLRTHIRRNPLYRVSPPAAAAIGAGIVGAAWAIYMFIF